MQAGETAVSYYESARAEDRLEHARSFLGSLDPRAGALIVAPSPAAALWLVGRALVPGQARLQWYRRTLDVLANELALPELTSRNLVPVRGLGAEALCARVVHELHEAGRLGRYAALRQHPGFARTLLSTITELRLAGVVPEALLERDPALGHALAGFTQTLQASGLADRALVLEAAARQLQSGGDVFAGRALLALDVLLLDRAEADFATALCANRAQVCIAHPIGDERSQARWHAALERLPAFSQSRRRTTPRPATSPLPATDLRRLQTRLFGRTSDVAEDPFERGRVRIISSPGESREAVEVARGILEAADGGLVFDRIAVVLRAVENYRAVMEEALARARIPAHFADGVRRPAPEGRALLALLRCAREGLSARAFAEYLSLGVTPAADGQDEFAQAPVSPRHWERLLIDAAVVGGRERWQRRLNGRTHALHAELAQLEPDDPGRDRIAREVAELADLGRCALPILDVLAALPEGQRWGDWLSALDALARLCLRAPNAVCEALGELAPLAPLGPVSIHEVCRVLERRLGSVLTRSTGGGAGKVFVGSVEDVLGRAFDLVFVTGLAEKVFPPRIDQDPLLPDRVRAELSDELVRMEDRIARERMAMRVAVGAARERVVLSFPRFDVEHNRARVPSFYGLEALRAVDGVLPAFDELSRRAEEGAAARMGWPAPVHPERAVDDAEYDLAVLARFRGANPERVGAARYFLLSNPHLARSLRFRARRWALSRFVAADGFVAEDAAGRALLAAHMPSARSYSSTALAQFATCPYKFYLHAIVGVAAREQAVELDELDARQRGILFHTVQRALLEALSARDWLPLQAAQGEAAEQLLREIFAATAERAREEYAPAIGRVFDAALETSLNDLLQWLSRLGGESVWAPLHMELGFGLRRLTPDDRSRAAPVRLESGLQLVGAIDIVERRLQPDEHGRQVLRATDHKTGAVPDKLGVISGGRVLQPALYALALERLFPEASVVSGRLYFCTSRAGFMSHEVALDARARSACSELSASISEMVENGFLPAAPAAGECERCAYQVVCGPYEEERVGRIKARDLERLKPLHRIRVLG